MKEKAQGLTKSDEYKKVIIKELEYVLQKMTESNSVDDKIYYFSAIQGVLHRVMNLEYTNNLLFAHFITNEVLKSLLQRNTGIKQGDTVVKLTEQHWIRLIEITKDFLDRILNYWKWVLPDGKGNPQNLVLWPIPHLVPLHALRSSRNQDIKCSPHKSMISGSGRPRGYLFSISVGESITPHLDKETHLFQIVSGK
jgi:hypothetical protein